MKADGGEEASPGASGSRTRRRVDAEYRVHTAPSAISDALGVWSRYKQRLLSRFDTLVKVCKYEEYRPTIKRYSNGSTKTTTGGASFQFLEVSESGESKKP